MSDRPKLNEELLDCTLKYIKKHPKNYNQNTWLDAIQGTLQEPYCGTTGCVAGWVCLLTLPEKTDWLKWANEKPGGYIRDFPGIAREKLGLTHEEADYLFGGCDYSGHKAQYKEILRRVAAIKRARKVGGDACPEDYHDAN